jgi:regulator of cell morphogenesis and NO signaling
MNHIDQTSPTLGDLARANPSATRVFLRHRLDFCCGGKRTLADACALAGLDHAEIAREIEIEASRHDDLPRWENRSQTELADHIERHYHAALRRDLPPLIAAARRVEKVHAGKASVPVGLGDLLDAFLLEMQTHMGIEETVLFPMIRQGAPGASVVTRVRALEREHDAHGVTLGIIRGMTDDLVTPPHGCATWRGLYEGLASLEADLMQHIHLENNILFLRAVTED